MSLIELKDLWEHQRKAVLAARENHSLGLLMEVGVGKTATMIYILREDFTAHKRIRNTLIFAPLSVCPQWKKEFAKFSKIPEKDILVLTGSGKKRTEALSARIQSGRPCIVVSNYEAVGIPAFYNALLKWSPEIVICDEAHRLKDASSKRAKAVYPLCNAAERRFILTGTPILNDLSDIYGQFKALDPRIFNQSFFAFRNQYFYNKNAGAPSHVTWPDWVPRPGAQEQLAAVIRRHAIQAKKSECLDLPPLLRVPVPVELSPAQSRAYESMKKHFIAELGDKVSIAEFAMTKTLRMQQILAGFIQPEDGSAPALVKENPRIDALEELLETIGPNEKVVIWTVFKVTYQMIAQVCERLGRQYHFLTGEQSATQKQESIETFCRGSGQILIANPRAGGAGINLTESRYAIYYTRGYGLEDYLQSEARNYRGGSDIHDKVVHYHIQATGTLDEVIANALLNKQNVADSVLEWARGAK
jgi:SNF2 family DNA or RNA helicase